MYKLFAQDFAIDFQETGGLVVLATPEQEEMAEKIVGRFKDFKISPQILKGKDINSVEPYLYPDEVCGAVYCPRKEGWILCRNLNVY